MFGLKIVKEDQLKLLTETVTTQQRTLEDIGWINMSSIEGSTSKDVIAGGFEKMLKRVKLYYVNNPLAANWVHLTTAFVFGEGLGKPKAVDESVQEIVDEFWDDPDNKLALTSVQAQHLLCNKLQYEGNLFFVLFTDELGHTKVRVLDTSEVADIIKDEDDKMRSNFYKVSEKKRKYNFKSDSYEMTTSEYVYYPDKDCDDFNQFGIPPQKLKSDAKILHVKINCDINDKFGIPELYRGIDWMQAHKNMAGDLATLIKALSTIAWKKKVKGSSAQVTSIAQSLTSKTSLKNIQNSAAQTQVENDGISLESVDIKQGGTDINIKGMREMKLMMCAGSQIPEHYWGDPSTGNLATSTTMELPVLKKFLNYQSLWTMIYDLILEYVLVSKVEVGLLSGTVTWDSKTRRKKLETEIDITIDIDFPPILKEELTTYANALKTAKEAGLITEELAGMFFMMAMNVDNIDDELEKLMQENEKKKEEQQQQFEQGLDAKGQQGNSFPAKGGDKKQVKEVDILAEAIDTPNKSNRFVRKGNYVTQRMNGYRKSLASNYKILVDRVSKSVEFSESDGKVVGNITQLDKYLSMFENDMKKSARQYFPVAVDIGVKFVQSHMKKTTVKESLFEANKKLPTFLQEMLDWNDEYITDSLIPDMRAKIMTSVKVSYDMKEDLFEAVREATNSFESRIEQYVGAFWTVEEKAVKEAGKGSGLMVNFAGADDEGTCTGCNEAMAGNPWKIDEAPVPGEHECGGRCRHALQIIDEEE